MRTIGVVTVSRSDYSICLPLLRRIQADSLLKLHLMVSGTHLSPEFGMTVRSIERDGFEIGAKVETLLSSDSPEGIAKSMGLALAGFAQSLTRLRPDILVVLGDRFDMYPAAVAALPFSIPVAHIHGGELTEGAIDDSLRHSLTKLSHLHFVATEEYARRVIRMGEEPWRVTVCGAPSLDNLHSLELLGKDELETHLGLSLDPAPLLVTFHPVTLEYQQTEWQIEQFLEALEQFDRPIIFTLPNADTNGRIIVDSIRQFVRNHANSIMAENLGTKIYFSMMAIAGAIAGNSSSGIVESASFKVPVVNVGTRQKRRIKPQNVINVECGTEQIVRGLERALDPAFRAELDEIVNPYGNGTASEKIINRLKTASLGSRLLQKSFFEGDPIVE